MRSNGFEMMHVPYKGEPPALMDFVAGRVQFMFATQSTSLPFVTTGQLRALATTSGERLPQLPDVPTLKDVGLPDMPTLPWAALFGPAGVPKDIVMRLNHEMNNILARPDIKARLAEQAFEPSGSTPEQLADMIKNQIQLWKTTLAELGIQPQ
ncbi:MAG: Bug family tripartite tricarboxylate transporter substrate binding protein [Pollutimonas bauzanensis]